MKTYTAQSGAMPQNIRILTDKVLITSDMKTLQIPDIGGNGDETEMYEYTIHEYTKDEYIGILQDKNTQLETELLDTQSALCDVYEMIGG